MTRPKVYQTTIDIFNKTIKLEHQDIANVLAMTIVVQTTFEEASVTPSVINRQQLPGQYPDYSTHS
jgi:hypothetical protein